MYTSDEAGNGKTHEIKKIIRNSIKQEILIERRNQHIRNVKNVKENISQNFRNIQDPSKPLKNAVEEKNLIKAFNNMDKAKINNLIHKSFEKIVISGFVTPELIERRMLKIKYSKKELKFLYIEIDYIENLSTQGYLLNDFLFNICVLGYFSFDEEPFFLPNDIEIFIEVSPYLNNVLYNQIVNLKLFRQINLSFDIDRFDMNEHCEFELDARILIEFYNQNLKDSSLKKLK